MMRSIRKTRSPLAAQALGGMLCNTDGETGGGAGATGGEQSEKIDGEEALGDAGKRALDAMKAAKKAATAERDAARAAADQAAADLGAIKDALAKALGLGNDDAKDDTSELVSSLQQRVAGMELENSVSALAREHGITDETDLALLRSVTDPEARKTWAARLARSQAASGNTPGKPGTPRPDPSQGKGGDGAAARPTSVRQVMEDRAAQRAKTTTNA